MVRGLFKGGIMKFKPRIAAAVAVLAVTAAVGGLAVSVTPAVASQAASALAAPPVQVSTNQGNSSLCFNRNGGGFDEGTKVIGYNCGDPNNDFQVQRTAECGGGSVTSTCPFNDRRLDNYYIGAAIVQIADYAHTLVLCAGTANSTTLTLSLTGCPNQGDAGWNTYWVAPGWTTYAPYWYISVHETNALGSYNKTWAACEAGYTRPITITPGTNQVPSAACDLYEVFS